MAKLSDISFAGSTVTVAGITIKDFMDDANPVEFQDVELSGVGINLNGNMIRYAKPTPIMMSVTVIPNSDSDKALFSLWKKYRIAEKWQSQWGESLSASVDCANGGGFSGSVKLSNGTMVSGPAGISATAEGKMQGRTYTFAFATVQS